MEHNKNRTVISDLGNAGTETIWAIGTSIAATAVHIINKIMNEEVRKLNNVVLLPTDVSTERILATYLHGLDDESPVWININPNFTKQYCCKEHTLAEILKDRIKAIEWFNLPLKN